MASCNQQSETAQRLNPKEAGFPAEVRWPRCRSDKADPIILPLPASFAHLRDWRVKHRPWWLNVEITPYGIVLQLANCGQFSGKLVLAHRSGFVVTLPVAAHVYPRTRQAISFGLAGLIAGCFAALFPVFGWWSLLLSFKVISREQRNCCWPW